MVHELKCTKCEKFLTCAPIYIRNTSGEAICGRCITDDDQPSVTRNKQYEVIARKILFPCANTENGCTEKIQFTENKYSTHEQNCRYRNRICPVSKSGECEWLGPWTKLVEHCQKEHPSNVLGNPCTLEHDITTESLSAYVLSALEVLFILHVKVCVKSAKIYHSLRYLGNPKTASNFKFKLDVERDGVILSKPGKIAPEGILSIQINSSLELCVNSLLSLLGGFKGTTFTITVQRVDKSGAVPKIKIPECSENNSSPNLNIVTHKEPSISISHCPKKYSGCHYKETEKKCLIHGRYYCMYITSCFLCNEQTKIPQIQHHYLDKHSDVTHQTGSMIRLNPATATNVWKYCLIKNNFGNLICWYTFTDLYFEIEITTPLSSEQLNKYECFVHIVNPRSKLENTYLLPRSMSSNSDWSIKILRASAVGVIPTIKKFDVAVLLTQI